MGRAIRVIAATVSVWAVFVPPSYAADVEARVEITPSSVVPGLNTTLISTLHLRTGSTPEQFTVQVRPPVFTDPDAGGRTEGALLHFSEIAVKGAATVISRRDLHIEPTCSPWSDMTHGHGPSVSWTELVMDADSEASVVATFATGRVIPWRVNPIQIPFELSNGGTPHGQGGTLEQPRTVLSPVVALAGPPALRLTIQTNPASSPKPFATVPRVPAGSVVEVFGSTDPPVPGDIVRLGYFNASGTQFHRLAALRVDADGRFRYSDWRPYEAGRHEIWAMYEQQRETVRSDYSCPHTFEVEGTAPSSGQQPGDPMPALRSPRLRASHRRVTARLQCAPRTTYGCRGRATLRARLESGRRRTFGSVRFWLATDETRLVSLPLAQRQTRWIRRHPSSPIELVLAVDGKTKTFRTTLRRVGR